MYFSRHRGARPWMEYSIHMESWPSEVQTIAPCFITAQWQCGLPIAKGVLKAVCLFWSWLCIHVSQEESEKNKTKQESDLTPEGVLFTGIALGMFYFLTWMVMMSMIITWFLIIVYVSNIFMSKGREVVYNKQKQKWSFLFKFKIFGILVRGDTWLKWKSPTPSIFYDFQKECFNLRNLRSSIFHGEMR